MGSNAYASAGQNLQRNATGRTDGGGQAPREVPTAGNVLVPMPLGLGGKVCMPWSGHVEHVIIVAGARVGVLDDDGKRRATGLAPLVEAGDDVGQVCLLARSRPACLPGGTSAHERTKGTHVWRESRR